MFFLKNMEENCILSFNGSRVTEAKLSLVSNIKVFIEALEL